MCEWKVNADRAAWYAPVPYKGVNDVSSVHINDKYRVELSSVVLAQRRSDFHDEVSDLFVQLLGVILIKHGTNELIEFK